MQEEMKSEQPQPHRKWPRRLALVLVILAVLAVLAFGAFKAISEAGRKKLTEGMSATQVDAEMLEGSTMESGVISYKGQKYRYNENLANVLFLGIDNKEEKFAVHDTWGTSGQADSIVLVSYDTVSNRARALALSRDAMVDIKCYNHEKEYMGWGENHLALGFAMGDGAQGSCGLMMENVSRLLYGVPIQSYCALSIQKVGDINDLFGGVSVTVPNDDLNINPYYLKAGSQVTLTGREATAFVQYRSNTENGSNNGRMERQTAYLNAFVQTAKAQIAQNPAIALSILQTMDGYLLTNVDTARIAYLMQKASELQFSAQTDFFSLPGENVYGGIYDEFHVDDEALFQLVLDMFYTEINE